MKIVMQFSICRRRRKEKIKTVGIDITILLSLPFLKKQAEKPQNKQTNKQTTENGPKEITPLV